MRSTLTLSALALLAVLGHAQTVLSDGHTDVAPIYDPSVGYDPNGLGLNVHYDVTDDDYEASDVLLTVYDNSLEARPSGSQYDFIGNTAGDNTWVIPQSQEPDKLYLGIGMDDLDDDPAPFAAYKQSDPRFNTTTAAKWVGVQLVASTGPGQISAWTNEINGPRVLFATSDGIGASDYVLTPEGGDNHFNWAFTAAGLYDVTFRAFTYYDLNGDGVRDAGDPLLQSPDTVYHFSISPQAVPEPGSLAALGLGAFALLRRRRKAA